MGFVFLGVIYLFSGRGRNRKFCFFGWFYRGLVLGVNVLFLKDFLVFFVRRLGWRIFGDGFSWVFMVLLFLRFLFFL